MQLSDLGPEPTDRCAELANPLSGRRHRRAGAARDGEAQAAFPQVAVSFVGPASRAAVVLGSFLTARHPVPGPHDAAALARRAGRGRVAGGSARSASGAGERDRVEWHAREDSNL